MNALLSLWMPILLSAVVVFVISSLIHMVFKWHTPDFAGLSNEDAARDVLRAGNPRPGIGYIVPFSTDTSAAGREALARKYAEGPSAVIVFGPNTQPNLGKLLAIWFLWTLVVAAMRLSRDATTG